VECLRVQTAARCKAVSALIVISPVIRGKKYLREARTTSLASILGVAEAKRPTLVLNDASSSSDAALEVAGFSLSAASRAALSQADLSGAQLPPGSGHADHRWQQPPHARRWAEVLCANEARTQYLALPGLIEMIMTPPHLEVFPRK